MNDYKRLYLTHANLKKPIHVILGRICFYYWSDDQKCTHVLTSAGVFPALEKPEDIDKLIDKTLNEKEFKV